MTTATRPAGYAGRQPTQPPDWHGLVAADVSLNAAATGLFLAAAVGELTRPDVLGTVAVWAYPVALVLLLADLACLVLDLGDPLRFHHMLRVFKPLSPMSLGTWFLTAYSLPLTLVVAADVFTLAGGTADVGWVRRVFLVVGLPLAFGSAAYKGVLFSTTAQPGWRDGRWLGAYHTSGALVFGGAGLVLLASLAGNDRAAEALRPALAVLVVLNLIPLGLLVRELGPALAAYPGGWRLGIGIALAVGGVLIPVGLLALGGGPTTVVAAALLLAAGVVGRSVIVRLPHAAWARPVPTR